MESLVTAQFANCYAGRRVLLSGHTGFKGSWLALWLHSLGAHVTGVALAPETRPNHWDNLALPIDDRRVNILDANALRQVVQDVQPEIVFHLAAQALVRRSYRDPLNTWATNVMGTANMLDAIRTCPSVQAVVAVTTDKCYINREWEWGYREDDRLGGYDAYSASKAAAELVASSYRQAFFNGPDSPAVATARAGNVIGGGDWSEDRLVPDLVRAVERGGALEIRSPRATRPWQHVLESLSGYLQLGARLLSGRQEYAAAWNFGPDAEGNQSVGAMLRELAGLWPELQWTESTAVQPHEATLLYLDSSRARHRLDWQPVWSYAETLAATAEWYRTFAASGRIVSREQLAAYVATACARGVRWTTR